MYQMPLCVDLFSGGGGFSIGFKAAGFQTIGFEYDKDISHNANKNGLNTITIDINKKTDEVIDIIRQTKTKVDVIVGGPPCQPFSQANMHRKGDKDDRNGIPAFLKVVQAIQPKIFIMEEAPTLLGVYKDYFIGVISDMEKLGYSIEYKKVDMSHFMVPQRRRRTIVVGHCGNKSILHDLTKDKTPVRCLLKRSEIEAVKMLEDNEPPTDSNFLNDATPFQTVSRIPVRVEKRLERFESTEFSRIIDINRPANTLTIGGCAYSSLRAMQNTGLRFLLVNKFDKWKLVDKMLTKEVYHSRKNRAIRGLTVHEIRRIQTFPDSYHFSAPTSSKRRKIAERIVGNAVPPNFAFVLASRIQGKTDHEIIEHVKRNKYTL